MKRRGGDRGIGKLAPGFLVASPSLRDPNFARAVVLLVEHGTSGSLGFVVNRPSSLTFERVVRSLALPQATVGDEPATAGPDDESPPETEAKIVEEAFEPFPLFVGGPVAPQSGWILFDPREASTDDMADAVRLSKRIALSASRALLERMSRKSSFAGSRLLAMGYSGWGAGQLDDELERGVWLPASLDHEVLFDVRPLERWTEILKREGIEPGRVVSPVSSATDPKNVS